MTRRPGSQIHGIAAHQSRKDDFWSFDMFVVKFVHLVRVICDWTLVRQASTLFCYRTRKIKSSQPTAGWTRYAVHSINDSGIANLQNISLKIRPIGKELLGLNHPEQWSFRGGTSGNAVPIVKIPLERMGTEFPLLSYGENARERCCIVTKLHNTFYFSPITPIHCTVDSPMAMTVHG